MLAICPECGQKLQLKQEVAAGKRIKCPKCAAVFSPCAIRKVDQVPEMRPLPRRATDNGADEDSHIPARWQRARATAGEEDDRSDEDFEEKPRRKKAKARAGNGEDWADDDEDRADDDDFDDRLRRKKARTRRGMSPALLWSLIGGGGGLALVGIVVLLIVLLGKTGGAVSRHEAALKEMVQLLLDLENALKEVKDPNSARVAANKINQICDRMEDLGKRIKDLPKINREESLQLDQRYKPQVDAINQRTLNVAIQARQNSRGEPTFRASGLRLIRVGQTLQNLGLK